MRSLALLRTLGAPLAARDGSGDTALGPWSLLEGHFLAVLADI